MCSFHKSIHELYPIVAMTTTPPIYIFQNGLRIVQPYHYIQRTTVKGRWFDKTVLQVFCDEFREFDQNYYTRKIRDNEIKIMRSIKGKEFEYKGDALFQLKLKSGDLVLHQRHKHETPVIGTNPIEIIHQDENLLIVNKPSGIPIHPVQNYNYNSVTEILKHDLQLPTIHPCHRLDKLTSGVSILCKNFESASKIQQQIQNREVGKEYIARVDGIFDNSITECNDDIIIVDTKKGQQDGVFRKTATTQFELLKTNTELNQSVVKCKPLTGRQHQIRVHLRNLGHPIVNDPMYNGRHGGIFGSVNSLESLDLTNSKNEFEILEQKSNIKREVLKSGYKCDVCEANLYICPSPEDLILYLHAYKYYKLSTTEEESGKFDWYYETTLPDWANI